MSPNDDYTLEVLHDLGLLTKAQIESAHQEAHAEGPLRHLIQNGTLTEEDVSRALAAQNSMEFVDLSQVHVERNVIGLLPADDARRYQAVPVGLREGVLVLAVADPMDMQSMDDLTYKLRRELEFVCSTPDAVRKLMSREKRAE